LIQSVWLAGVSLWGARPDLMLLVVVAWSVVRGIDEGLIWGFIGGLSLDVLSGGPLGGYVLALLAVALLAGQPWGQGLGLALVRLLLLTLVGVLIYHLILLLVLAWTGHTVHWVFSLARTVGPSAVLHALLIPFVWRPLAWLDRRIQGERFAL
jgi:rod shape-determining protein MreD